MNLIPIIIGGTEMIAGIICLADGHKEVNIIGALLIVFGMLSVLFSL